MANVDWASSFFNKVTSRLPDLLTKAGEGKELEALDQLRAELKKENDAEKAERSKELQAELDRLNGREMATVPEPDTKPEATEAPKARR